jgi:hypothetical protein
MARKTLRYRSANPVQRGTSSASAPADSGEETPAMRQLLADIRTMPPDRLRPCWQKGITLAALSLAQSES